VPVRKRAIIVKKAAFRRILIRTVAKSKDKFLTIKRKIINRSVIVNFYPFFDGTRFALEIITGTGSIGKN